MYLGRRIASACGAIIVLAVAGCGGSVSEVSGTVTYDGKPIEKGSITFIPADGNGTTEGGIITDGKYSVKKVPLGQMKVVITASRVIGKVDSYGPGGPQRDKSEQYLPEKYSNRDTSELRYDVVPGKNDKDFPLTSN